MIIYKRFTLFSLSGFCFETCFLPCFCLAEPDDLEAEVLQEPSGADRDGGLPQPVLDMWVTEREGAEEVEYVTSSLVFHTCSLHVMPFMEILE